MVTIVSLAVAVVALGMGTATLNADDDEARAKLYDAAGNEIGKVKFIQHDDEVLVKADDLEFPASLVPGFKGFHIHATGVCDPRAVDTAGATVPFFTAGGHYNPASRTHGDHAGDMPVLLVNADGTASSRFKTDHFDVSEIIGRAVIVHALADNYANIPVGSGDTQYRPNTIGSTNSTATGLTANTGNAGARFACGVVTED
jgi:Cu-Zn family superoxide dismutase